MGGKGEREFKETQMQMQMEGRGDEGKDVLDIVDIVDILDTLLRTQECRTDQSYVNTSVVDVVESRT